MIRGTGEFTWGSCHTLADIEAPLVLVGALQEAHFVIYDWRIAEMIFECFSVGIVRLFLGDAFAKGHWIKDKVTAKVFIEENFGTFILGYTLA